MAEDIVALVCKKLHLPRKRRRWLEERVCLQRLTPHSPSLSYPESSNWWREVVRGLGGENTPNCALWKRSRCRYLRRFGGLLCVCVHVCSRAFLPLTGNYNFEFLNHRLFKSKAAPAGQMKVVILFPPSIILAFSSTICHYRELHLVICVLWPDTCAQREPICVGGVSGQRRRLIWDQSACRRLQEPRRVGSCARLADSSLRRCLSNECVVMPFLVCAHHVDCHQLSKFNTRLYRSYKPLLFKY